MGAGAHQARPFASWQGPSAGLPQGAPPVPRAGGAAHLAVLAPPQAHGRLPPGQCGHGSLLAPRTHCSLPLCAQGRRPANAGGAPLLSPSSCQMIIIAPVPMSAVTAAFKSSLQQL